MLMLYWKALMDSQVEEMYKSLGIEPNRDPVYPEIRAAKRTYRVKCFEGVGTLLVRTGKKLLRSARNNNISQEPASG